MQPYIAIKPKPNTAILKGLGRKNHLPDIGKTVDL